MIRLFCLVLLLCSTPLAAQEYPQPLTPFVNDFADLLAPEDEAQLTAMLEGLRASHDVEMTVVTIRNRAEYGQSDTIEEFATGLFNAWGVGDATRNDGVMILVARQDREMRIELGSGYDRAWDWQAQLVIDDYFLPSFRADNYRRAIMTGTARAIDLIAVAHAEGAAPPDSGGGDGFGGVAAVFAAFAAMLGLSRRSQIADLLMRWRRCPGCGKRGLRVARTTLTPASLTASGQSQRDVFCPSCDRRDTSYHTIPQLRRRSSGAGGSFGGGRSSGGGASGRW